MAESVRHGAPLLHTVMKGFGSKETLQTRQPLWAPDSKRPCHWIFFEQPTQRPTLPIDIYPIRLRGRCDHPLPFLGCQGHIVQRCLRISVDPLPKPGIKQHAHHHALDHSRTHRETSSRARAVVASTAAMRCKPGITAVSGFRSHSNTTALRFGARGAIHSKICQVGGKTCGVWSSSQYAKPSCSLGVVPATCSSTIRSRGNSARPVHGG